MVAYNSKAKPTPANIRRRLSTVVEAIWQVEQMLQARGSNTTRSVVKLQAARRLILEAADGAGLPIDWPTRGEQ